MTLLTILEEIENSMEHRSEYRGILPPITLPMALSIYQLATSPFSNVRAVRMRYGVLDGHPMLSGVLAIERGAERDMMLMLAPAPFGIDEATALLARDRTMIAAYQNRINGYESVAFWDDIESPRPKDVESIYQDIFIGPLDLKIGTSGLGIAVAVRRLIETRTGYPLGLEPESI
jgi:hypothetical protein